MYNEQGKLVMAKVKRYTLKGKLVNGEHDKTTSIDEILGGCADFSTEVSALTELVQDQYNQLLLMSPKCHPELAGNGVE